MAETQFVIPARNLKVFSKIVQCMAKIGDDLFFDVTYDKVFPSPAETTSKSNSH